jgi:outer membrane receptor protein involved in Fe transport
VIALALLLTLAPAAPQGAPRANGTVVTGVVLDQTGAVLPGATVQLIDGAGAAVQTTTADARGAFRFETVTTGSYELRAAFEGFKTAASKLRVGNRPPGAQRLVLEIAGVTQEVTVSDGQAEATAASNLDAVAVDLNMLENLPVFDLDYVATVSRFLDSSAIGTGGVTLLVNGMEVSALRVSASAIQQIRINQDPYSAEYARPGRGRIEILTKPGSQHYEGELNLVGRDARFDARNAFAPAKPAERKTIAEGVFGGPLGGGRKTSFFLSGHDERDDQQAVIFAVGPSGTIEDVIPQPTAESLLSGSVTWQHSPATTISIRPNYQYESSRNRGAGGTTLASAASNFSHHEQQITYTQQTILRPTLLHQFQILFGHEREPTVSASSQRGLVVAGAFTGGGAQADLVRTETHIQLTESLGWTRGRHALRAGFQLPDWSRRGFEDRTNFGGTYFFSGLDAYAAGRPYAYTQQSGQGTLALLEKQVGVYVKDDYQMRPGLSVAFGLRYDWQNYFHDNDNVAPRASFAYAPGNRKATVIRGGAGLFTDRSGPVVIADVLHSQPGGLVRYVISNPPYPDPTPALAAGAQPPSIVRLATDVQIPQTLQYGVSVDRQLYKSTTMSVAYTRTHGHHLFRSRDVNAPLPPLYAARPDATLGVVRQVESTGRQQSDSLQVTVRGKMTRWFNGQTQYTWSRAYNDTGGINAFPSNDYDLAGEWARAEFDRRHRFLVLGRVSASRIADLGVGLTMNSAGPYTAFVGEDIFHNGRGRARPAGVPRNSLEGAGYASLDLRASRDIKMGAPPKGQDGRSISLALDVFNLLNRVNYGSFVGTIGSPLFGQAVSARAPRQLQLSARLKF